MKKMKIGRILALLLVLMLALGTVSVYATDNSAKTESEAK